MLKRLNPNRTAAETTAPETATNAATETTAEERRQNANAARNVR